MFGSKFHMFSPNKRIADLTRKKPIKGMPKMKLNKGLGAPPKIKL